MELYGRNPPAGEGQPDPETGLEESMWRLGLGGRGRTSGDLQYPERPGEPDCTYYLRTGSCGYGDRCRFNHPRDRGGVLAVSGRTGAAEYPERVGQPACEYYMKTGTCKFGSTCKYNHPRQGSGTGWRVLLNYFGYPLREGEKECSYYMKTGQCKFGATCKFHHPQPAGASVPSPAPAFYPTVQPPSIPSPQQYPHLASWQIGRPMLPGSYVSGSYGPMLVSPGGLPVQSWSPYPAPVSPVVSPVGQQTAVQAGALYGLSNQVSSSVPSSPRPFTPIRPTTGPSSSSQREHVFPQRPGQPECLFYMRTGDCKFGDTCKYHHPPDWRIPTTNCVLSPLGLPLREGAPPCAYYAQHGVCKFGPTCKFDHPIGTLSYSPSASSLSDMPVAPYPIGFSMATLAPSSSSSELRHEFTSSRESFSTRMPLSQNTSSGSVGSIYSTGGFAPHSLIQPQTSTLSSSGGAGQSGDISGSN